MFLMFLFSRLKAKKEDRNSKTLSRSYGNLAASINDGASERWMETRSENRQDRHKQREAQPCPVIQIIFTPGVCVEVIVSCERGF